VYLDGVPITGSGSTMALQSGEIAGLAEVRDGAAVTYQSQLDEIARGLIEAFAESDQSGGGFPDVPGLFTYAGAIGIPPTGTLVDGLAGRITVAASVDPAQGGNPALLRDGAISGDPAYTYNATGGASFVDRLNALLGQMSGARSFDATAQAGSNASLVDFASNSVSWLQEARKVASTEADYRATVHQQASDALSKETGVNLDDQMAAMLELERAYQATAKLISVVDAMMNTLIESIR
jgi:flagellar hook-associated protein 1 FlgK